MLQRFKATLKALSVQEKLLIALVFCLPFERTPAFEVSGYTLKLSFIFGCLLIAAGLVQFFKNRQWKLLVKKPVLIIPALLPAYSGLSVLWAQNNNYWLRANIVFGFCVLVFYAVYFTTSAAKKSSALLMLLARTVLISAVVVIAFGLWQWLGDLLNLGSALTAIRPEYDADRLGLPRIHSTFLEPMWMGCFLLLPLSILLADTKQLITKSLLARLGLGFGILLVIGLSLSRGALLVAGVITLLGVIYNIKSGLHVKISRRFVLFGIISLLVFGLLMTVVVSRFSKKGNDPNNNYERGFSTITSHLARFNIFERRSSTTGPTSLSDRTIGRQNGTTVLTRSTFVVLFGVGAGQFGSYVQPDSGPEATSWVTLLDFWVSYGVFAILGFIGFIGFMVFQQIVILRSKKTPALIRTLAAASLLYLAGFWLQSFSTGSSTIVHLWVWLAIASSLSLLKAGSKKTA